MDFRWSRSKAGPKRSGGAERSSREQLARESRKLRREAVEASSRGKRKKALECYLALERLEPGEPGWSHRVAEVYRQLGRTEESIEAFERAAEKYAGRRFPVKASAVCRAILRVDPDHEGARRLLARLDPAGPARGTGSAGSVRGTGSAGAVRGAGSAASAVRGIGSAGPTRGTGPAGSATGLGPAAAAARGADVVRAGRAMEV